MKVAVFVAIATFTSIAYATPTREHPLEDNARVVPDADEPALETELRALHSDTGVALGVIVVPTTGNKTIESYARAHREEWSHGTAPAALFVLAVTDRHSRLEVNDALRDKFPDARAHGILDNLRGYLRSSDYAGAIRAVIREVRNGASGVAPDLESPHPQSGSASAEPGTTPSYSPSPYSYTAPSPIAPTTSDVPTASRESRDDSNTSVFLAIAFGVALFVFISCMWARDRIASRATISSQGVEVRASLLAETLTCMGLILGSVLYFALLALAAGASESSSSSSSDWGSSDSSSGSGSSSSSSSGGWSGGGASSSW